MSSNWPKTGRIRTYDWWCTRLQESCGWFKHTGTESFFCCNFFHFKFFYFFCFKQISIILILISLPSLIVYHTIFCLWQIVYRMVLCVYLYQKTLFDISYNYFRKSKKNWNSGGILQMIFCLFQKQRKFFHHKSPLSHSTNH